MATPPPAAWRRSAPPPLDNDLVAPSSPPPRVMSAWEDATPKPAGRSRRSRRKRANKPLPKSQRGDAYKARPRLVQHREDSARPTGSNMTPFHRFNRRPSRKVRPASPVHTDVEWTQRFLDPQNEVRHEFYRTYFAKPAKARIPTLDLPARADVTASTARRPASTRMAASGGATWDPRFSVSASAGNGRRPAGCRHLFDRPLPHDPASPAPPPRLVDGYVMGPSGKFELVPPSSPVVRAAVAAAASPRSPMSTARLSPPGSPATTRPRTGTDFSTPRRAPASPMMLATPGTPPPRAPSPTPLVSSPGRSALAARRRVLPHLRVVTKREAAWDAHHHVTPSKSNDRLNRLDRCYFDTPRVLHGDGTTSPVLPA